MDRAVWLFRLGSAEIFANTMSYPADSNQLAYQIVRVIRTSANARSLALEMARTIGQTFGADLCLFVAGISARPRMVTGFWDTKTSSELSFEITKGIFSYPLVREMLRGTKALAIADLQDTERQPTADWIEKMPVRSLLGITTHYQSNANGIIMVGYLQPHEWTAQEQEWMETAAEVGAIASYVAQLEKVTKVNTEKTFAIESSPLFKKWYELTHQQLEQQRQLNQLKDEIITAISDRARNPLASMKLAMEMLSRERNMPLPPESEARYWDILKQEWQRLNDLINNIVTLKKLESHEVSYNPEIVSLNSLVNELVELYQTQWQQDKRKQLTISATFDAPQTIYTDPRHVRSILSELLTNAGNFSLPETTISIDVTEKDAQIAIAVTNISRGIPAKEQAFIFEPFRRGESAIELSIPGVGLGLALVKKLAELLNGKIEVASNPTDNPDSYITYFTLTLPQVRDRKT